MKRAARTIPAPAEGGALNAREASALATLRALRGEAFVADELRGLRAQGRLSPRESALAMEIALGAVRHQVTLDRVLAAVGEYEPRRVPDPLRAILLGAAYQVIWLDRVPLFAAVDEAAKLAGRYGSRRAVGMVNALLRRLTRAIDERRAEWRRLDPRRVRVGWNEACVFRQPVLPDPQNSALERWAAAATGERPARYRQLVERLGAEQAEQVAWASQAVPPVVLVRNPLRAGLAQFREAAVAQWGASVEFEGDAAFLRAGTAFVESSLFAGGWAWAQDVTQLEAARLLGARCGERVLDLCAAPGGKAMALAAAMEDRGEVVACDAAAERIRQVEENASRLGLRSVRVQLLEREEGSDGIAGAAFDAAIVDVPCSNSGTIARRPEARLRAAAQRLASLVQVQKALLRRAAACVRPGGRLVYCTCSIEPQENEQVVADFLRQSGEWSLEQQRLVLPQWGERLSMWRDGGFAALLVRR